MGGAGRRKNGIDSASSKAVGAKEGSAPGVDATEVGIAVGRALLADGGQGREAVAAAAAEGAAEGAGLGVQFLRHLSRTRLLLHIVDIHDVSGGTPQSAVETIVRELEGFDPELASRERWLVFNKADTLDPSAAAEIVEETCSALKWNRPWFLISGVSGQGCAEMCQKIGH